MIKWQKFEKNFYIDSIDYIFDELKRIDILLKLAVIRYQENLNTEKNGLAGLYISEKEIDKYLNEVKEKRIEKASENFLVAQLEKALEKQQELIAYKTEIIRKKGIIYPLQHLKRVFGLTPFEIDALLICLAPELDAKYEKLYAYLQDDITKKYPTLDLIFMVLTHNFKDKVLASYYFSEQAPLIKWQLLRFANHNDEKPRLTTPIWIDKHIKDFLLGNLFLDPSIGENINILQSQEKIDNLFIKEEQKQELKNLIKNIQENKEFRNNMVIHFHGPPGVGKKKAALAIASALGFPVLCISAKELLKENGKFFDIVKRIIREALLFQCLILIEDFDFFLSEEGKNSYFRSYLLKECSNFFYITFLISEKSWEIKKELENTKYIKIYFPFPDFKFRKKIWEKAIRDEFNIPVSLPLDALAYKFKFSEAQIVAAVKSAKNKAFLFSPEKVLITAEDLLISCREQNNHKLSELALKIIPKYSWDDIILPDDQLSQLKEICSHVKYHYKVYQEWGFVDKLSLGKGLNVLFCGFPGTGKTMAAEIIANELKLELYKIDLSQVVSKYVGETEKNLSKIFKEAETANIILFFDEADALFGKRTEIKNAHDRYANIEIGYLLQKIEEYEGVVILATNFRRNIDEAFIRRMHFIVDFPFPDEKMRKEIWKKIFPKEAPLDKDINFEYLAKNFKLSGGSIRNAALRAAFYAAEEEEKISMKHIIKGIKRELQKMGKILQINNKDWR